MKTLYTLALLTTLAGCQTCPPTLEVKVPVPVPCVVQMPTRPALLTDAELARLPDAQLVLALRLQSIMAVDYAAQLEAVAIACLMR